MESKHKSPNYYDLSQTKRNVYYTMEDKDYLSFLNETLLRNNGKKSLGDLDIKSLFIPNPESAGKSPNG